LVVLDWDDCEAEAFKLLSAFSFNESLRRIPTIGYLSQAKRHLKDEAQNAGCHRVYGKTEFTKGIEDLFMRYAA